MGGNDETIPEEDFGGYGHVEEREVRLLDAGTAEKLFEGVDSGAVKVENFIEGGHVVCDVSEARDCASRCLLTFTGVVRVEHGARV